MEKIIIKVPGQYRYMGEWNEFINLFPRFPHIMDKQVPGCGFTEWCLTNPDNVILCSPRNMLILNKWEQHPDDVFRVHNDKYDIDPGVDRDLNNDSKEKSEVETFIQTLERLSKEEKESFTSQLFRDLDNYFKRMDSCKKPYTILVTYDSFRILKDVLKEQGFKKLNSNDKWELKSEGKYYVTTNDSAIAAFVVGKKDPQEAGFKIIGAHTDSPTFKIKPMPEMTPEGKYLKLNTEVYGGPI